MTVVACRELPRRREYKRASEHGHFLDLLLKVSDPPLLHHCRRSPLALSGIGWRLSNGQSDSQLTQTQRRCHRLRYPSARMSVMPECCHCCRWDHVRFAEHAVGFLHLSRFGEGTVSKWNRKSRKTLRVNRRSTDEGPAGAIPPWPPVPTDVSATVFVEVLSSPSAPPLTLSVRFIIRRRSCRRAFQPLPPAEIRFTRYKQSVGLARIGNYLSGP